MLVLCQKFSWTDTAAHGAAIFGFPGAIPRKNPKYARNAKAPIGIGHAEKRSFPKRSMQVSLQANRKRHKCVRMIVKQDSNIHVETPEMSTTFQDAQKLTTYMGLRPQPEKIDWSFNGCPTQQSVHGMHTWLAAMIPALAEKLLRVTEAAKVLDPFCGGGAVLVESSFLGREAFGIDINPLATIVSKAKTTPIAKERLTSELKDILRFARDYSGPTRFFPKNYFVGYWYKPYMLKPLTALSTAILNVKDEQVKTFFQCAFSATARDVALNYRNEIRLRRMTRRELASFNPDVLLQFSKRANDAIARLSSARFQAAVKVEQGDVTTMPFADDTFSTIVCSPPYGDERNGVPYFQFAKNMLYWLGWTKEELLALKRKTLGWVGGRKEVSCPESPTLKRCLEKLRHNGRARLEAVAFYHDYEKALRRMVRVTHDKMAIVIGNRVLLNTTFDNAEITTELLDRLGVRLMSRYRRQLPSKRLPRMREFGAAINSEDILIHDVTRKNV